MFGGSQSEFLNLKSGKIIEAYVDSLKLRSVNACVCVCVSVCLSLSLSVSSLQSQDLCLSLLSGTQQSMLWPSGPLASSPRLDTLSLNSWQPSIA